MPAIHVRDVPEMVAAALRERARRNRRSMQHEMLQILEEAATAPLPSEDVPQLSLRTVRVGHHATTWSRDEIYGDDGGR